MDFDRDLEILAALGMQPVTETLEVAAWVALFLATLGFYPLQRKGG